MMASEMDLHGLTQGEAIDALVTECNAALDRAGGPVTVRVIHGYGSSGEGGVLRDRIRGFCRRHAALVGVVPGEASDGNQGVTTLTVSGRLPDRSERLGEKS